MTWIIKYALTSGCFEQETEPTYWEDMVKAKVDGYCPHYFKPDWQDTKEEAIKAVQRKVVARKRALTKALLKIEKIESMLARGELPMQVQK